MSRTNGCYISKFEYPRKINWCSVCNVPILSDANKCPLCGYDIKTLAVGKGEVRPVFEPEKEWYRDLLQSEGKDPDVWLPGGLAFYYRGSIIVGGEKVFRVTFDEANRKWMIKFFKKYQNKIPDIAGSIEKILVEANLQTLEVAELESLNFIHYTRQEHHDMPMGVSFSGGKDSSVLLYLMRQLFPEIDVIYLNTTIDYPETEKYIKELQSDWGFNLIEVRPSRDFFDFCEDLGPPSQYMRWCCKITKFAPLNRLIEERYGTTVLMASGIRKNESNSRNTYSKIQINDKIPKQLLFFPIFEWNSLLVWLYIFWKKIPINEAYQVGRSRIGCWACPERRSKEFSKLKRTHPNLWKKLSDTLYIYAKNNNIENVDDWINFGKWRFRASKYNKSYIKTQKLCSQYDQILYKINEDCNMEKIKEFLKVFGEKESTGKIFKIRNHFLEASIIGNNVRVSFNKPSSKIKNNFKSQIEKAVNCVNCGACLGICEIGAIKIVNHEIKISNECNHCLNCLNNNGLRNGCIALNYKKSQKRVKY